MLHRVASVSKDVVLSLVPQVSLDSHVNERADHSVVERSAHARVDLAAGVTRRVLAVRQHIIRCPQLNHSTSHTARNQAHRRSVGAQLVRQCLSKVPACGAEVCQNASVCLATPRADSIHGLDVMGLLSCQPRTGCLGRQHSHVRPNNVRGLRLRVVREETDPQVVVFAAGDGVQRVVARERVGQCQLHVALSAAEVHVTKRDVGQRRLAGVGARRARTRHSEREVSPSLHRVQINLPVAVRVDG